jgi:hypothetical protein
LLQLPTRRLVLALTLWAAVCFVRSQPAPIYILDEVDAALDLSHTQNIGRMIRTHFPQSQFIVVSLKEGMFNNANVIFRTKARPVAACAYPSRDSRARTPVAASTRARCRIAAAERVCSRLTAPPPQFVDGVSTVMRTVPALKDKPAGANQAQQEEAAKRRRVASAAAAKENQVPA